MGPTPRPATRPRWAALALAVVLAVLALGAPWVAMRPPAWSKLLAASPSAVLLTAADIPQAGWGEWASGVNGTGAWRSFSGHSEAFLATFNLTLWVEPDAAAAAARMDAIVGAAGYPTQDGGVSGADASLFWTYSYGGLAGMALRRYNVAFVLVGASETPFSVTRSDLGRWSGWQLARIESLAT